MEKHTLNDIEKKRKELVLNLKAMGINPFGHKFLTKYTNKALKDKF